MMKVEGQNSMAVENLQADTKARAEADKKVIAETQRKAEKRYMEMKASINAEPAQDASASGVKMEAAASEREATADTGSILDQQNI